MQARLVRLTRYPLCTTSIPRTPPLSLSRVSLPLPNNPANMRLENFQQHRYTRSGDFQLRLELLDEKPVVLGTAREKIVSILLLKGKGKRNVHVVAEVLLRTREKSEGQNDEVLEREERTLSVSIDTREIMEISSSLSSTVKKSALAEATPLGRILR
jgi:hypothetical protein